MEKPILFNTEMVKAILDGKKTTTRRIIKDVEGQEFLGFSFCSTPKENEGKAIFQWNGLHRSINHIKPPYNVGDILYVRETWIMQSMSNFDKKAKFLFKAKPNEKLKEVILSSDRYEELIKYAYRNGWQPSLFMPKEAARIFLKVTDVRVERLKNMTTKDVLKEGVYNEIFENYFGEMKTKLMFEFWENLWNSTLNKNQIEMYGWDADPWVWVIEFERIKKNEGGANG